jgi:hypothetical protein
VDPKRAPLPSQGGRDSEDAYYHEAAKRPTGFSKEKFPDIRNPKLVLSDLAEASQSEIETAHRL